MGFGELVQGTPLVATVNEGTIIESPKDWTVAGTSVPKVNGRDFVTGRHRYTSDVRRDGMLHARIVRPPAYGSTLARVDSSAVDNTPGVTVVRDGEFLGVAAPTASAAADAAAAIKAEWTPGMGASARTLFADLKTKLSGGGGAPFVAGSIDEGLARGEARVDGEYTIAYIAHAPLEPRAAVAEWADGHLTVWTGTQRPFGVRQELADAFQLPQDRVRVIVPDTGSAYGGKHTGEAAIEAARLAGAAGKPVKLVWTREEEFARAYFRPAGVIEVRAAAQKDGTISAWEFHNYNSGPAAIRTPYAIPNQRVAFHGSQSALRQGSYRGLAATANHFARESHMDDLAHAVGIDPLAFRLRNLRDERLIAVLKAATDTFGWSGRKNSPRGIGLAGGVEKGSYTATCVEIDADRSTGRVVLKRVVVAFECGAIVSPNGLHNQVEGAIVQGLGGALFEAIDFDDGKLTNGRFSQYRVPRFSDVPPIEVVLVDRRDLPPAGAGETPIVGIAPAIGNAIFGATGVRLRSLPLIPRGLPSATNQL
jgi:isoquinoline 1-oxidoreductase